MFGSWIIWRSVNEARILTEPSADQLQLRNVQPYTITPSRKYHVGIYSGPKTGSADPSRRSLLAGWRRS